MSRYAVLIGRIQQQMRELQLEHDYALEQAEAAKTTQIDAYWIAAGFGLQGYYTGIERLIQEGVDEGAIALVDGRNPNVPGYEQGFFVRPTILQNVNPLGNIAKTEIFDPVLSLIHLETIDDAIAPINQGQYGNMACLFTSSGAAARKFRHEAEAGNIGINIGVAAPMAQFPFSGWKDSFFGDLHGQGHHAVEFFTQTKVVIERWHDWTRQF